MGPDASEGDGGSSIPTRAECKTRRRSSGGIRDDIPPSLPPPAVGLMFSASSTDQFASAGFLTARTQNLAGAGEAHVLGDNSISPDMTRKSSLRARISNLGHPWSSSTDGKDMRQLPMNIDEPSETTALLTDGNAHSFSQSSGNVSVAEDWIENEGKVETTRDQEFLILLKYSLPLMFTCVLQYSLSGASVIAVGHLGKTELGAVSLAIMTSNVTGYCAYAGLATSLDTLCAQAYGSGKPHLVGLQLQRMVYFLWIITIPIAAVWLCGTQILLWLTPEPECAELAGLFLKVLILGAPGFALFEAGKRFVQAQGLFNANLYVLLVCAPLNAFMNWLFVWVRNTALLT